MASLPLVDAQSCCSRQVCSQQRAEGSCGFWLSWGPRHPGGVGWRRRLGEASRGVWHPHNSLHACRCLDKHASVTLRPYHNHHHHPLAGQVDVYACCWVGGTLVLGWEHPSGMPVDHDFYCGSLCPWCRRLEAMSPQLYPDNVKCNSVCPRVLFWCC